ncbi:MAG: hypothetical protein M0008_04630 [Actinomycetota bacterium]|jgi:hypothetical protein|nr:hypothetical protein [Actinomycetota bacterium]
MTYSIRSSHFNIEPWQLLSPKSQRSHPGLQRVGHYWSRYRVVGILVALALGMTACSGSPGGGTAHRAAKSTGSSASPNTFSTPAPAPGTRKGASWPSKQVGASYAQLTAQPLPGDFNPACQGTTYKFIAGQEVALTGTGFPAGAPVTVLVLAPERSNAPARKPVTVTPERSNAPARKPVRVTVVAGKTGSFHATVRIPLWANGMGAFPGSPAGPLYFIAGSQGAGPHQISATGLAEVLPRGSYCKPK